MGAVVIRNPCYTPQGDNPNNNIDGGIYSDYPMLVEIVRLAKKNQKIKNYLSVAPFYADKTTQKAICPPCSRWLKQ
ncbi:hypothetical protein [Bacteroides acidifaciens]|jgi:hypothetical protein|uniref:hypothetical protein n=1 Tax=Bacteroides acidifaciens TaxID=85831 RepID=UPI002557CC31|nr:hypothetical protein [Bacteroides acidifaciens]